MARPHDVAQLVVIPRVLVTVADDSAQRRPRRMAVEKAALYFKGIFFRTRRRQFILPRCPPGHFLVDGIPVDGDARRKSVQDGSDRDAMGFPENRKSEGLSKGIHLILPPFQ